MVRQWWEKFFDRRLQAGSGPDARQGLRFRASQQRANRSPNVQELFTAHSSPISSTAIRALALLPRLQRLSAR